MDVSEKSIQIEDTPIYDTDLIIIYQSGRHPTVSRHQHQGRTHLWTLTCSFSTRCWKQWHEDTGEGIIEGQVASRGVNMTHQIYRWYYHWWLRPAKSVHWPASGTVKDTAINFMGIIEYHLRTGDVYLIFEWYLPGSTQLERMPPENINWLCIPHCRRRRRYSMYPKTKHGWSNSSVSTWWIMRYRTPTDWLSPRKIMFLTKLAMVWNSKRLHTERLMLLLYKIW